MTRAVLIFFKKLMLGRASRLNVAPSCPKLEPIALGDHIPKIIHQTYRNNDLPVEIKKNVDAIKKLNPDWEYRFYDDGQVIEFIKKNYPGVVLDYYLRINPKYGAARADLFRYLLMYKCGGVYLDIKSTINKPLSETLGNDNSYLLSHWKNDQEDQFKGWGLHKEISFLRKGEFQQWFIISPPGHPFLKAVIEGVIRNIDCYRPDMHGMGKYGVIRVTGPIAYTLAICPLLDSCKYRLVDITSEIGASYSVFRSNRGHQQMFMINYDLIDEPIICRP